MAKWIVHMRPDALFDLHYLDPEIDWSQKCGTAGEGTTKDELVDWVITQGKASPGDIIIFDTGEVLQVSPIEGRG